LRGEDKRASGQRLRTSGPRRKPLQDDTPPSAEAALFAGLPPLLSERPGYLLWRIALRSRELIDQALEPLGIRAKTFALLAFLSHIGPISQQALGHYAGVDASTMVALVDGLEALGVIERRRDPRDRRAYLLHLTTAGKRVLETAGKLTTNVERELLAPLEPAEQEQLVDLLKAVAAARSG
jgi:DNA-binding MarR family transcriptional regulator